MTWPLTWLNVSATTLNVTLQLLVIYRFPRCFVTNTVEMLNNLFSVFKQHYIYFYTLFHPHVFQKTTNNITHYLGSVWIQLKTEN